MRVSVYDTYIPKNEHSLMHFDILVEEKTTIESVYNYGKTYLKSKGITGLSLSTKECNFCHMETAPDQVEKEILKRGYYIIEMENCN